MLLEKQITEGEVVSIKLSNGDEIIARLEKDDHNGITINKPLALTMGAKGGLGMIPWIFLGDKDTITLKREHIFVMVPSKKDAAQQYIEGTTGIALA